MYAELPKYFYKEELQYNTMIRLQRRLHGLKDASKIWFDLIMKKLKEAELQQLDSAPCLFTRERMILICRVDDLLVFGNTKEDVAKLREHLGKDVVLEGLGNQPRHLV